MIFFFITENFQKDVNLHSHLTNLRIYKNSVKRNIQEAPTYRRRTNSIFILKWMNFSIRGT